MNKERFVTFCDAIIAIIITIMVLEIHPPEISDWEHFSHILIPMLAYALSFLTIWGVWRNFHRIFRDIEDISPETFWYTGLWIFVQSFFPFSTSWVGEAPMAVMPELFYNIVLTLWMICFRFIRRSLIKSNDSKLKSLSNNPRTAYIPWAVVMINYLLVWFYPPIVLISLIVMFPFSFMDRFRFWNSENE